MATHSTDEARSKDPERVQEKCLPAAHAGSPVSGGYKNFFRCTYGCLVVLLFVMIGSLVFKQIRWDRVLVLVPRRWGAVCLGCVFSMAPLVCAAPWWVGLILLWAWILWALWVRRPPGVPRDSATQCSLWFSDGRAVPASTAPSWLCGIRCASGFPASGCMVQIPGCGECLGWLSLVQFEFLRRPTRFGGAAPAGALFPRFGFADGSGANVAAYLVPRLLEDLL